MNARKTSISLCFALSLIAFGGPAKAQPQPPAIAEPTASSSPENGVYFNPIAVVLGVYSVGYERVLSNYLSLLVQPFYFRPWSYLTDETGMEMWGVGGMVKPYIFLQGRGPHGWYLAPFASLSYLEADLDDVHGSAVGWDVGAVGGYGWLLSNMFSLRLGLGLGYGHQVVEATDSSGNEERIGEKGLAPYGELSFAFMF